MNKEELDQIVNFDNTEKFREYWESLGDAEKAKHLSMEKGSFLRNVIGRGIPEISKFLIDQLENDHLILGDEENPYPLFVFLLTTKKIWDSEDIDLKQRSLNTIFYHLVLKLPEDELNIFIDYFMQENSLFDECLENDLIRPARLLCQMITDEKEQNRANEKIDAAIKKSLVRTVTKIPTVLESVKKGIGKVFIRKSIMNNVFGIEYSPDENVNVPDEVINAVMQMASYAIKLEDESDDVADQKVKQMNQLVSDLYEAGGDSLDPHVRIAAMRDLVKSQLESRDNNPLWRNRSGGHKYETASKFANFFKRPHYKYVAEDGTTYFANSTTEHRAIALLDALDKWDNSTRGMHFPHLF